MALLGEALLTVNIYNRPPELGGKLYCPSVSKTFKIGLVDLAIVEFKVSPLQVKRGEQLKLTVKVKNEGKFTQAFDLHIYINESLVRILPVKELEADSQKVIFSTLETLNMSEGSYLIKAYIPPLPGETDISDNERTVSINVLQAKPSPPFAWNLFLLLLIIILLLAISITLLILLKKRKRKEGESGHLTALVQLSV